MITEIHRPREHTTTVMLAKDENQFFDDLAEALGISKAQVMRNAIIATLMASNDPIGTAREQHVTERARMDKWRRDRAAKAKPVPPRPPQPMR